MTALPSVTVARDLMGSYVPRLSISEGFEFPVDVGHVVAAAGALAHRFRTETIAGLPLGIEVTVVLEGGVESFYYTLRPNEVTMAREPGLAPRVTMTLQKAVDLLLMENGVSLMAIVASGRARLNGSFDDVMGTFGRAEYAAPAGRRSASDLSRLLIEARPAARGDVARILDEFGREDFARELVFFFAEAAELSGIPRRLPSAVVRFVIGDTTRFVCISHERSFVIECHEGLKPDATITVPKMETMIDRLLGRIGDLDALLARKVLVQGAGMDDLMPLFEQLSAGLTVFTSSVFGSSRDESTSWTFPSEDPA